MRDPEQFDAFYKGARDRLLVQTFALTGDLAASRRSVRDAFIVGWHHWRKVARLEDPETSVRQTAWRLAQRRHTARVWHRERQLPAEVMTIVEALAKLTGPQRRTLVLTQLAVVSMPQMAREVGLPLEQAERELQVGATQLSLLLDVPTSGLRSVFEQLGTAVVERVHWPRAPIVRRSGAARRRMHTAIGVAAAAVSVAVTGALVTDTTGQRPVLDRSAAADEPADDRELTPDVVPTLPETSLVSSSQVSDRYDERAWITERTGDNEGGNGRVVPCQTDRFADPRGAAALVRVFRATESGTQAPMSATQITEASASPKAARRTFRSTATWFAGCTEPRVQLLSTRRPAGLGDESVQLALRSWNRPVTTYVVGVARTGIYTTTTFVEKHGEAKPDKEAAARLLADAVGGLCSLEQGGACAPEGGRPDVPLQDPLPVGTSPALLSEIDLPPVRRIDQPWVGTEPRRARTNDAASACDATSFEGSFRSKRFRRSATRTFVIPEAELSEEFGLTETIGSLPGRTAGALMERVRAQLATCPDRDLNTDVDLVARFDDGPRSLSAWRLRIDVTQQRTVTLYMAFFRAGSSVGQLGFIPDGVRDLPSGTFVALAERALERLGQLPGYAD